MAATTMQVPPRTRTRRVRETWCVDYTDFESGGTREIEVDCLRGMFFAEFRRILTALGLDSEEFDIERSLWSRQLVGTYYEPEQPLIKKD